MASETFRYLLHADLDAFYASVEQADNSALRGKPVVVGGSPENRGVVAAASYEARNYGVKSAMPMRTAMKLCPGILRVSPRFERYRELSNEVMQIFRQFTSTIEPLSMDEAYLDLSGAHSLSSCHAIGASIRKTVREDTHLIVTIGGGTTKTVAKISSQLAKPNGILLVQPGRERTFLSPLSVRMLPGVGPKSSEFLEANDVNTIGDLAQSKDEWLYQSLGKRGITLKQRSMGLGNHVLNTRRVTKSVSAETTTPTDIDEVDVLMREVHDLSTNVSRRLKQGQLRGRTISVKTRLADFTTFSRQTTLKHPVDCSDHIFKICRELVLRDFRHGRKFRLIGVSVSNFPRAIQLPLLKC